MIRFMLFTSAYIPHVDTHPKCSDVTNEVAGIGYISGGATLPDKEVLTENTDSEDVFDADNVIILVNDSGSRVAD